MLSSERNCRKSSHKARVQVVCASIKANHVIARSGKGEVFSGKVSIDEDNEVDHLHQTATHDDLRSSKIKTARFCPPGRGALIMCLCSSLSMISAALL